MKAKKLKNAKPAREEAYKMNCPFHKDESHAFYITEKGIHCFACGRRWDRNKKQ